MTTMTTRTKRKRKRKTMTTMMTPPEDAEQLEAIHRIVTGIRLLPKFSNYCINWGTIGTIVGICFERPGSLDIFVDVPIDLLLDEPHGERIVCGLFHQQFLRNQIHETA